MYTISVKTFSGECKQFHYIDTELALDVFNRLAAAQDAKEIVMIDGLTGEWYASYERIDGMWMLDLSQTYIESWDF